MLSGTEFITWDARILGKVRVLIREGRHQFTEDHFVRRFESDFAEVYPRSRPSRIPKRIRLGLNRLVALDLLERVDYGVYRPNIEAIRCLRRRRWF